MTDGNNHQRWSRPRDEALDAVYFESAAALDEGSQFPSLTYEAVSYTHLTLPTTPYV